MNFEPPEMEKWKPGVSRNVLLLIAGILWLGIGITLDGLSWSWLKIEQPTSALLSAMTGFVCALVIHHFGFLRIVDRNLGRILPMEGKRCMGVSP